MLAFRCGCRGQDRVLSRSTCDTTRRVAAQRGYIPMAGWYESWSAPFSVMLVVPLGVLGALVSADVRGLANDVYFQVGVLTTVGLSAKNAILIVEFAQDLQDR